MTTDSHVNPEEIVLRRGSASLAELGLDANQALALARKFPTIEPVFLVKFRSRQGKTRVEEIRSYAWPGQKIAFTHLGYRAEDARLLRLETRQAAEFPGRLFARFERTPKQLEELRGAAKLYERAMKQAPSKPGRAERDVLPLVNAFKKLGSDVAIEMLIDTAATFQKIDNALYASKMLGNLLKLVQKDRTVDISLLARTVLAAADDGVFNAHLYEFTWTEIAKKQGMKTALGLGLRVFRRLMLSGRAIPTDFVKVMRKAAITGKVSDFEDVFDRTVVWAAGVPSFWNTARKTAEWRDAATQDHGETQLLRTRLRELWMRAGDGETAAAWKREIWGRVQVAMPELTSYGRTILTETLLAVSESSAVTREEGERILEAALAMLVKPPRNSDRTRTERAGNQALFRVATMLPDMLWERTGALEDALRTATGNLTSYVAVSDLISDVSEALPPREGKTLLRSISGLEAAWTGALVAALGKTERETDDDDNDYSDDDDSDSAPPPVVPLLGEALALMTPENAPEHLAELGKLVASRLARDLTGSGAASAWGRVLATLRALGPVGEGVTTEATSRFLEKNAQSEHIAQAAPIAHSLDKDALRRAAEARRIADEVLEVALEKVTPAPEIVPLMRPAKETGTDSPHLVEALRLDDGSFRCLWTDKEDLDDAKTYAITAITKDAKKQTVVAHGNAKGFRTIRIWASPGGLRVLTVKDRAVQLLDEKLAAVGKLALPEEFKGTWGLAVHVERYHALFEQSEHVVVVDSALKVVSEVEGKGYGRWWISESPDGKLPPLIVHQSYGGINALYLEGKRIPPPKPGDMKELRTLARTDDGGFFMDYTSKKNEPKRARWDGNAWKTSAATTPERPVTDFGSFGGGLEDQRKTYDRGFRGWAFAGNDRIVIADPIGTRLAAFPDHKGNCQCLDLETGIAIYQEAIVIDRSLSARLDAAKDLRAAIVGKDAAGEGAPLSRALYSDRGGLAKHVRTVIESREAGRSALATLGEHADALLDAAAGEVLGRLAARDKVLTALDGPAPAVRPVPPRVPGVGRSDLRRLVRTHVRGAIAGSVFWALDGADASPVLDFIADRPDEGIPLAFRLLMLAQDPKTDSTLAARLLDLTSAIVTALKNPTYDFVVAPDTYDWVDDDDDLASGRTMGMLVLNANASDSLRSRPSREHRKNELPIPWTDDSEARGAKTRTWLAKEFGLERGADAVEQVGKNEENGRVYRLPLLAKNADQDHDGRAVDVSVVFKKDVFKWEITGISGQAKMAEWEALLQRLEETAERLGAGKRRIFPGKGLVRADLLDSLAEAVSMTRTRIDDRASLQPPAWKAPPVKGAEEARQAQWVMLTWLLGGLHYETASTTKKTFDAIAKACKLVTSGWYGMSPNIGKKKEDWDDEDDGAGTPELLAQRARTFVRLSGDRRFADLIVLRDPQEIIDVYTRTVAAAEAPKAAAKGKGARK